MSASAKAKPVSAWATSFVSPASIWRVMLGAHGRVLGATIVGHHAGELLHPWILMVQKGMKIGDMAGAIAPYPTLSESSKRAAGNAFTPTLFSARTRRVVRFLQALP